MQSTEKVNKKKKILNYERAPGICDNGERSKIRSMPAKTVKTRYIMYHVPPHLLSQSDLLLSGTMHLLCNYVSIV